MKFHIYTTLLFVCVFLSFSCGEAAAQNKEPDMMQIAEQEADRLAKLLDLEDWQVFYVDSTLKANYNHLKTEMDKLQMSKVTNTSIYMDVQDRCMEAIENDYKKWFTEAQWKAYLKSGAAKAQKQREKRRQQKIQ